MGRVISHLCLAPIPEPAKRIVRKTLGWVESEMAGVLETVPSGETILSHAGQG